MAYQDSYPNEPLAQSTNQPHNIQELRKTPHLEVYTQSSILIGEDNLVKAIWFEGKQTKAAQERYRKITSSLQSGFLDDKIEAAKSARVAPVFETNLTESHKQALEKVVDSITAQRGRALVEILILQLAVKAISPEQDIRLHKSSRGSENNGQRSRFSWVEGISMRRLDDTYIVPTLRKKGLLRMNEYGAFMTRTFAENYPYSLFYKAEISGAKRSWLEIIDDLEERQLDAEAALLYVLDLLWKSSEQFKRLVDEVLEKLDGWIATNIQHVTSGVTNLIKLHILAIFLTWAIFNPIPGTVTLLRLPVYTGQLDIALAPWQAILLLIVGGYFLWTRKLALGILSGIIPAFIVAHWVPLPEWRLVQVAFFHSLTVLISDQGLLTAITKVIGYAGMVLATLALVVTARDVELIGALRQLHVPPVVTFFLATVFRSLDLALADYDTIHSAQVARAVNARPRSFMRRLRDLASIAVPMVAMMIRRSSEIGDALLARGYVLGRRDKDFYETSPWRLLDWGVVALSLGLLYLAVGPHPNVTTLLWGSY